jgi:putative two-component system response regulator
MGQRPTTRAMMVMPDASGGAQRIVVVQDSAGARLLTTALGAAGYHDLHTVTEPADVEPQVDRLDPDLVILDLQLRGADGFELLQRLVTRHTPVLVLSEDDSPTARRRALGLGARDYVITPLDRVEVLLRIGNLLQTRRLQRALEDRNHDLQRWVRARTHDLEDARRETLERLALAAEYRDDDTAQHTKRVGRTAALLARQLGLSGDTVEHLRYAAPLHDVGKIGIPDAVWLRPGKLTDHERKSLEEHTAIGARILSGSRSPILRLAEQIARAHHERWDGSGYPDGLAGDAIPLAGRITAVADVFDVLAHPRPHKKAWPLEQAVAEIVDQAGRHFDPEVVAAFRRLDAAALLEQVDEPLRRAA